MSEKMETQGAPLVHVVIDGHEVAVPSGTTIVEAAQKVGVRIPTLCHHTDLHAAGVCRICVVEVEGQRTLSASCAYPITSPITVTTNSKRIRQARRHVIDLMLSEHCGDCYSCVRNKNCELQNLAKEYGVHSFRFGHPDKQKRVIDTSSDAIVRDMNKCVSCLRCVRTCEELQGIKILGSVGRGDSKEVSTYLEKPIGDAGCINCGQCVNRCPTGALHEKDSTDEIWAAIDDPTKHVVIQTAPAPRVAIGEEFDLEPGTPMTWELNTALRRCGFDKVFDTNFSADLTILEEGTELILRLYNNLVQKDTSMPLPQFTSCCPGWIKYYEHAYPQMLAHLSSCKSPQQMFGAVIKTWYAHLHNIEPENIVSVSLMPCTAKKFECNRPEMRDSRYKDVDFALTTRECARMIHEAGIHLPSMPKSDFDDPFGTASGSGVIFGATGGVMEAALRSVVEFVTGLSIESIFEHADIIPVRGFEGCRYAEIKVPEKVGPVPDMLKHLVPDWKWLSGATLKVGVAHGIANAKKIMEDVAAGGVFSQCHFIEVMACPGGCIGGGGQPIPTNQDIRAARAAGIYKEDSSCGEAGRVRKSHENPAVLRLYKEFFTEGPCGHKSHNLLHTHYTPRGKYVA
ncbi:MAG: 2Fe-2S iron-sulfur cluster binding domain-containing protein [Alphaproteobacteria bacterium]|nr:2Fe-2S iron-sulfur cluster binding domain-containing protein [Alphaproteobacteria bacterium]